MDIDFLQIWDFDVKGTAGGGGGGWVCNLVSFGCKLWEGSLCEWLLVKGCVCYIFASLF